MEQNRNYYQKYIGYLEHLDEDDRVYLPKFKHRKYLDKWEVSTESLQGGYLYSRHLRDEFYDD